jgi:hypothetical protein
MAGKAVFKKYAAEFGVLATRSRFYGLGAGFEMVDGDKKLNTAILKKMAKEEGVALSASKLGGQDKNTLALFDYRADKMVFNSADTYITMPNRVTARLYSTQFLSSNNPRHPFFHELGHRKYYNKGKLDENQSKVAGSLSRYAKTSAAEFLAETYAAYAGGAKLSRDVIKQFKDLAYHNPYRNEKGGGKAALNRSGRSDVIYPKKTVPKEKLVKVKFPDGFME